MAHIPSGTTQELELVTFRQALEAADTPSDEYDIKKWIYAPNFYSEYRYILGTRGKKPLICIGIGDGPVLIVGGLIVFAMGVFLAVYYLSFGIFYDGESFLMSRFGKKDAVHRYEEIVGQKLYVVQGGSVVAELYLKDGSTVSLQSTMDGVYPFLDTAFAGWCLQTGRDPESCDFHDPSKSLWFPPVEES